jgi:ABC-type antimicrobial peptide transport system permease subunit
MKNYDLKKLLLAAVILGLIMAVPLSLINFLARTPKNAELMHLILRVSLTMNIFVIAFPIVFRYASKPKGKNEE